MHLLVVPGAIAITAVAFQSQLMAQTSKPKSKVVLASEIQWEQLNPARGDASPKAATLWGDRKGTQATGFLVKFVDGFSSPPHIHNVSYRGVVIAGGVHNDDPDAKPMWMPTGSFWTQPAGEPHITSSRGSSIAYIEIESGPYLVMPVEEATDNGERPINVIPSNYVWLNSSNTSHLKPLANPTKDGTKPMITFLWGKPQRDRLSGTLVRLPSGFQGELQSHGKRMQAVVIQGQTELNDPDESHSFLLEPGSYVSSQGATAHKIRNEGNEDCLLYVRSLGHFTIESN